MHFHICICMVFFQLVFNDETWMNVESSGTFKKAPVSAETLDLNILSELNTVPSSFTSV